MCLQERKKALDISLRCQLKDVRARSGMNGWNTTLRLVEAVTDLNPQSLNSLLEAQGHKALCLSAREWSQLKELVDILSPFLQATDLTQEEKVETVSAALPCVLSLNSHLIHMLNASGWLSESTAEVIPMPFPGDVCKCQNG